MPWGVIPEQDSCPHRLCLTHTLKPSLRNHSIFNPKLSIFLSMCDLLMANLLCEVKKYELTPKKSPKSNVAFFTHHDVISIQSTFLALLSHPPTQYICDRRSLKKWAHRTSLDTTGSTLFSLNSIFTFSIYRPVFCGILAIKWRGSSSSALLLRKSIFSIRYP